MILVSSKDDFAGVKQRIEQKSLGDIEISGAVFFDDSTAEVGKKYDDVPVVGSLNNFTDNIVTDLVDEVMFVLPKGGVVPEILLQDLLNMGITSHVSISELYDNERGMKTIEKVGGYTVMTESLKIASGFQLALKRLMDILGGIVGLLITAGRSFIFRIPDQSSSRKNVSVKTGEFSKFTNSAACIRMPRNARKNLWR